MKAHAKTYHGTTFTPLSPERFPKYNQGAITRAYMLSDGHIVGYCPKTREWLKWNTKNELHVAFGRTRAEAARLEDIGDSWIKNEPVKEPDLTSHDPVHALDNHPKVNIRPRYFNVAAITTDGRTISTQVWTANTAEADAVLAKWLTPEQEHWHGQIAIGSIHDMLSGVTTFYRRDGVGLLRLDALKP